ncbi:MAG: PhzF family phenazine biosynthesis protein [Defluviitaleaceae bacterium]|nr:PhzF family phenazine biosynthesis protein [Defluviitaleaceae bacterium]
MRFYQVDAFTDAVFGGNPAGVCILGDTWISDDLMQKIAMENNLSETAFVVQENDVYAIRWFTPTVEVPLCGHATLAAAHVLFNHEGYEEDEIIFTNGDKTLKVRNSSGLLTLDFPVDKIWQIEFSDMLDCFNFRPAEVWRGTEEYMLVFENQKQIEDIVCNMDKASKIDLSGIIATAKANDDGLSFVSRYFAPKIGIPEDPVTGSTHTLLVPYWSEKLGEDSHVAQQSSARGGVLFLQNDNDRVLIGGRAVTYLAGEIFV